MQEHFRNATVELEADHWWYRARRRILERALDRLVGETRLTLTVGVGITKEAEMLSKRGALVAIDRAPIDPRCAAFCLPIRADALSLPFAAESFDAVFLFDVLEHIELDDQVLTEIRRVLRTGGKLLLTVPAFMMLFGRQDIVSEHKRRYRRGPLKTLMRRSGFEVDYATYFNTLLFPPIAALRLVRRVFPERESNGKSDFDLRLPRPIEVGLEKLFAIERYAIDGASLPFGVSILCSARRL